MSLCTPRDPSSAAWTRSAPSPSVVKRLAALARSLAPALERSLTQAASSSGDTGAQGAEAGGSRSGIWRTAFLPRLQDFDVIVRLRPGALPHAGRSLAGSSGATDPQSGNVVRECVNGAAVPVSKEVRAEACSWSVLS